jgi:hypothetical protein
VTRLVAALLAAAGALLYLSFGYTEMAGSDLWWHIAAGRELVQTGNLWMVDDWSWSAHGEDWLNHEWLADLVFYGWVVQWGVESLVYWKWLVIVCAFLLLQFALARDSGHLAAFLWSALAMATAAPFIDVRPHLYSLLLFCLLLYLALGRKAPLWVLAPLFLVWVNLHGGFFFGLMALAILLFPWRDFSVASLRGAALAGLPCALIVLLNPYGIDAYLYPLKYAFQESSPYRQLAEWLPPFQPGGIRSPLFFTFMWMPVLALAYCLPVIRRQTAVPWEGLALTALTLAMALTSRRFIPLFAISLAVLMAPLTGVFLKRLERSLVGLALAIVALVVAALRVAPLPLAAAPAFHYLTTSYAYPVEIVNFMRANDLRGKVFAYYNWGGYLHLRTDGDLKVFIDGRADTLYNAQHYIDYVNVLHSRPGWVDWLNDSDAEFVMWPERRGKGGKKIGELLATGEWQFLYNDHTGWLLVRSGLALPASWQETRPSPERELRLARLASAQGDMAGATRHALNARAEVPWHRDACRYLATIYRGEKQEAAAQEVLDECRDYFPTPQFD